VKNFAVKREERQREAQLMEEIVQRRKELEKEQQQQ
jgi:hypothetical protein